MTGDWAALQEKRAKHATEALSSDSSRPSTSTLPPPPPPAPTGPLPSQLPTPSSEPSFSSPNAEWPAGSAGDVSSGGFEVRLIAGRGRGVFTNKAYQAGSTLIATKPLVSVLDNRHHESNCSYCFRSCEGVGSTNGMRCSACKSIKYCSAACSKLDWQAHKPECEALKRYLKATETAGYDSKTTLPDTPVRALGRLLWAMSRSETVLKAASSMQSLRQQLLPTQLEEFLKLSVVISVYVGHATIERTCGSGSALIDLCSRFTSNSFSLTDPYLSNIGVTLSPTIALFNHSCSPNAVVVFPNYPSSSNTKFMRVVAIRPLVADEEVLTSYIDLGLTFALRQSELGERYAFGCDCELCSYTLEKRKNWVDPRQALVCFNGDCGQLVSLIRGDSSIPPAPFCSKCSTVIPADEERLAKALEESETKMKFAESRQYTNPTQTGALLSTAVDELRSLHLAPSSFPLLPISQMYLSALLYSSSSEEAMMLSLSVMRGTLLVNPAGHPSRAIATATMAKLTTRRDLEDEEAYWGNTLALMGTIKAVDLAITEVKIAFGIGSLLERELRQVRQETQEGMKMWTTKENAIRAALGSRERQKVIK